MQQPGKPSERNRHGPPVTEINREGVFCYRYALSSWHLDFNRGNTHSKPPVIFCGACSRTFECDLFLAGKIHRSFATGSDRARTLQLCRYAQHEHAPVHRGRPRKRRSGRDHPSILSAFTPASCPILLPDYRASIFRLPDSRCKNRFYCDLYNLATTFQSLSPEFRGQYTPIDG